MKKRNRKVTSGSAIEMMRRVTTGIRSLIKYSMSAVFNTDTGEHYLYNSGSSREANNSELFSGRQLVLDATQELPIEVPYTLGAEGFANPTFDADVSWIKQSGWTISGGEAHCDGISNGVTIYQNAITDVGNTYELTVEVTAYTSGTLLARIGENPEAYYPITSIGTFKITGTRTSTVNNFSGLTSVNFAGSVTIASIKQITTPANTAITYWDATANEYVQDESIPVSTTYTFTNQSVGEIAPTTKPFTTADIALMNADNQLLGQLALGSTTTGLSLVTADLYGYYPVSENIDKYISNVLATYGTNIVPNGTFDTGIAGWVGFGGLVEWNSSLQALDVSNNGAQGFASTTTTPVDISTLYLLETELVNNMIDGEIRIGVSIGGNVKASTAGVYSVYVYTGASTALQIRFQQVSTTLGTLSTVDNVTFRKATASEVSNYLSTVRTNGDQSPYGMQLVGFKQDSLGLPTAVADAGTTQWTADGRTATTGWTVTAPFTVTEAVDGVTYTFTSDANRYTDGVADGTYTLPTGEWVLDNTAFDGVTPVTARGTTKMVEAVVIP